MKIDVNLVCGECVDAEFMHPVGGYDSPGPAEYYKCAGCSKVIELQIWVTPHIKTYSPGMPIPKPMTQQERNRQVHRQVIQELRSASPQEMRQRLVASGILTQDGELAPQYKPAPPTGGKNETE